MNWASLSVLVVDDEQFARSLVIRVLMSLGIELIHEAENGAKAIEVLHDENKKIDLIISDIEMPEMDGFKFARKIRYGIVERYKKVPFLMLTGRDTEDNIRKGRIHKIDGFILKPPNAEDLRTCIVSAINTRA